MRIPINNIKLNPGRRTTEPEDVENLAKSIAELGLLNPITINQDNTLIAGRVVFENKAIYYGNVPDADFFRMHKHTGFRQRWKLCPHSGESRPARGGIRS